MRLADTFGRSSGPPFALAGFRGAPLREQDEEGWLCVVPLAGERDALHTLGVQKTCRHGTLGRGLGGVVVLGWRLDLMIVEP